MGLFENITTINASENYLSLGSLSQFNLLEDSIITNSLLYNWLKNRLNASQI